MKVARPPIPEALLVIARVFGKDLEILYEPCNEKRYKKLADLGHDIEPARGVLISGQQPEWVFYDRDLQASAWIAWFGMACFQKKPKGIVDVP